MRNQHGLWAAGAAVAVGAAFPATPAVASVGRITDPARVTSHVAAKSRLALTFAYGAKASPAARRATLTCAPAGGSHRDARKACAAIGAVGGDLTKLVPAQTICTMQYDPVTVTATGRWRGSPLRYSHTFSNACVLGADTGPVFDF